MRNTDQQSSRRPTRFTLTAATASSGSRLHQMHMPPPPGIASARPSGFTSGPAPGIPSRFSQAPAGRFQLAAGATGAAATKASAPSTDIGGTEKKKIRVDGQGRVVDEKGQLVEMQREAELMVNQRAGVAGGNRILDGLAARGNAAPGSEKEKAQNYQELLKKRTFYDTSLESSTKRRKKELTFSEHGQFVRLGDRMRKQQYIQMLEKAEVEKARAGSVYGPGEAREKPIIIKSSQLVSMQKERKGEGIPEVEWWDQYLLPPSSSAFPARPLQATDINLERITHYVQHPVPVKNQRVERISQVAAPIHLTDKEKRKLDRKKRLEKEREKQEAVRLGLAPAPLPKIKMSNYQKIMAKDAIANPSGAEIVAKAIIQKRQDDHFAANQKRKEEAEPKESKMARKHMLAKDMECCQALFRIDCDLQNQPQNRFKIMKNAQQLHLSGFFVTLDPVFEGPQISAVVFVEGGPKEMKKYKALLLRRIKWEKPSAGHPDDGDQREGKEMGDEAAKESADRECFLVWQGVADKPACSAFKSTFDLKKECEAAKLFSEKKLDHIWSAVVNFQAGRAQAEEESA